MSIVYLNGKYVPLEEATVSVENRGFMLGDGIYEVVQLYGGKSFRMDEHMERFRASAAAVRLPLIPAVEEIPQIIERLVAENGLSDESIYIQYTRGPAHPRTHAFPKVVNPTLLVMDLPCAPLSEEQWVNGVASITVPDIRWQCCAIKTVMLLPNALAKQEAVEKGGYEAILVRNGIVTEGSSSNIFIAKNGELITYPLDGTILGGITRVVVLEIAARLGITVREEAFTVDELYAADEVFLTSTTHGPVPISQVDGKPIGSGKTGPIARRIIHEYEEETA